ncbi:MAG: glycosyltransferase family A protein [Woeseia sp.]
MRAANGNGRPGVSVIIPTTCEKGRKALLRRAISCVLSQKDVDIELIIVVNGNRVCEELYEQLDADRELKLARLETGSLPAAQRHGRGLVTKEYFTLLDDDDELLPEALRYRSSVLQNDQTIDALVSNGYVTYDGSTDELHVTNFDFARGDPLAALMQKNWLASCGALFRTRTIPFDFFDGVTKYHEWTLLAVRILLADRKLAFLDRPTFRKHEEIDNSLSKSEAYRNSSLEFLRNLLLFDMPRHAKTELKKKIGRTLHSKADACRRRGDLSAAWTYHLRSMSYPDRWRYLLYTRKLLLPVRGAGKAL